MTNDLRMTLQGQSLTHVDIWRLSSSLRTRRNYIKVSKIMTDVVQYVWKLTLADAPSLFHIRSLFSTFWNCIILLILLPLFFVHPPTHPSWNRCGCTIRPNPVCLPVGQESRFQKKDRWKTASDIQTLGSIVPNVCGLDPFLCKNIWTAGGAAAGMTGGMLKLCCSLQCARWWWSRYRNLKRLGIFLPAIWFQKCSSVWPKMCEN